MVEQRSGQGCDGVETLEREGAWRWVMGLVVSCGEMEE